MIFHFFYKLQRNEVLTFFFDLIKRKKIQMSTILRKKDEKSTFCAIDHGK